MRYWNLKYHFYSGVNKSKPELMLSKLIREKFPLLKFRENARDIVPGGLELDFYFPTQKLAIELNGPIHYFPIFGDERLQQIQGKDLRKREFCSQNGISLLSIDISHLKSHKKTIEFMEQQFESAVRPLLI